MAEAWHVGRTLRVLELLAFSPLSAPQIAATLDAHPRTIRRVLARLVEEEYLTCGEGPRRLYTPTMRLVALAGQVVERSPLAARARPYVRLLHERAGATSHLVVPSYDRVLCLVHAAADDDHVRSRLRELVPAHCTAGGKALLAGRARWRESLLSRPLERHTERTVADPAELRRVLRQAAADGYASEDGEYQPGVRAVAAPVVVGGETVAALTASGERLALDATMPHVVRTAAELSDDLGDDADASWPLR